MGTIAEERPTRARHGVPEDSAGTASVVPEISEEERLVMAQCCAFFAAERYREAGPGTIRSADIERAKAQIDALVETCRLAGCGMDT